MALVLKKLYKTYVYLDREVADPATSRDFFVTSELFLVGTIAAYVYIVKRLGPKLMQNTSPFNIKNLIIVYNIIQVLVNLKLCYESIVIISSSPYKICVVSLDKELNILIRKEFLALKLLDCVETVFFVLRKSYRQISFLHVYHHCGMVLAGWVGNKFDIGGAQFYISAVNCFVHSVMFVYYLLTIIDPEWKKNLTMKKLVTQIQLVQFLFFVIFYSSTQLIPNCNAFPTPLAIIFVGQNLFMFCLFSDFYVKTYWRQNTKDKRT